MTDLEVVPEGDDLRCSVLTAALGERPIGSAGSWHRVVLVELPLPWPDEITDHPMLAGIDHGLREGRRHRVLALASALTPSVARPDDGLRVICYWRAPDERSGFRRAEVCAPDEDVGEIVELLLDVPDDELAAMPTDGFAAGAPAVEPPVRDLIVCTHGTRDRCCGKLGTDLFRVLVDRAPPGVRVWRTSHTGGHRFAPTALTFPDGWAWAGLDEPTALGIVDRTATVDEVAAQARGSVAVDAGPAQVADAAGLATEGWSWLDEHRRITVGDDPGDGTIPLRLATSDGRWSAVVRQGRSVPIPDCGNPLSAARKHATEWELVSFEES